MNPYLPIRKVPLDYNGISSSAYAVQMQHESGKGTLDTEWKETGVVGHSYLLVDNDSVRKAAEQVAEESKLQFVHDKTFFNGRSYAYSLKSDHVVGEVAQGDDVALGMQFWNSYDGSKAFGFAMMLYRLICTNGMMSKNHFRTYRFKHQPSSENWTESLDQVVSNINNLVGGKDMKRRGALDEFLRNLRSLSNLEVTTEELGRLRHNHLKDVPIQLWGNIVDRYTDPNNHVPHNGWTLLNAATDLLWHKKKPTVASYGQNATIVDGLCQAVA
jgi:hypothetical protein